MRTLNLWLRAFNPKDMPELQLTWRSYVARTAAGAFIAGAAGRPDRKTMRQWAASAGSGAMVCWVMGQRI